MLYANATPKDLEKLTQAMKQSKNVKEYQRLHIIQLSLKGKTVPELADLFEPCTATIRDYIRHLS